MIPLAKRPAPAAVAALRQATALWPKRNKASDGLLPSKDHVKQNPNSDHNSGFAVDLTHDPEKGVYCQIIYTELQKDPRVKYLIFKGRIWSRKRVKIFILEVTNTQSISISLSRRTVEMTPHLGSLGFQRRK
jgi:hypothetical protein